MTNTVGQPGFEIPIIFKLNLKLLSILKQNWINFELACFYNSNKNKTGE